VAKFHLRSRVKSYYKVIMSSRSPVLVLSRHRAGDTDLIARIYSRWGILTLLVREGFLPENRYHGVFEPFNQMVLDFRQMGSVVVPEDLQELKRYSYLSRDYERFRWMSHVCEFILKQVRFWDEELFGRMIDLLLKDPRRKFYVLRVLLRVEFLKFSGIIPLFLREKIPRGKVRIRLSDGLPDSGGEYEISGGALRLIGKIYKEKNHGRVSSSKKICLEAEEFLDALINYHTK
jgi:hypothetical protein